MVPNTSAGFCIDFLRECLARYGIPEVAVMDNGPPFRSYEIKTFFERNGIHAMFSPAYHPESNGLAEVSERELPLEFALIKALYAYRLSPLTRTEKSPAGIFLNREIRTKISMLSKKSVRVGGLKNKKQNNSYKINDRVRYRWMERGKPKWMFGIVKRIVGSNSCMIETDGIERKVHTNYMRRSMERKDVSSSEEGISYPRSQTSSPLTPATIVAESTPGPPTESTPSRRYPLRERRPPDRYELEPVPYHRSGQVLPVELTWGSPGFSFAVALDSPDSTVVRLDVNSFAINELMEFVASKFDGKCFLFYLSVVLLSGVES
ncbi:K02A2.6-like [Cordylochernes scorpioides]|uniref:K02A2.6-like n=1 Tax=Cordylochernes scorpioides TaxID=51811 RepID=A0ABY6L1N6_9ARAC|nr:K02A2.6-like [Cordylochernes scorpioides]